MTIGAAVLTGAGLEKSLVDYVNGDFSTRFTYSPLSAGVISGGVRDQGSGLEWPLLCASVKAKISIVPGDLMLLRSHLYSLIPSPWPLISPPRPARASSDLDKRQSLLRHWRHAAACIARARPR